MISVYLNGMDVKDFDRYCMEQIGRLPFFEYHNHDAYTGQHTFYNECEDDDESIELWFDRTNDGIEACAIVDGIELESVSRGFMRSCF